jgi:hypothetical protein
VHDWSVTADRESDQPERPLHHMHLIALRLAPFVLWAAGIFFLLVGSFWGRTDAQSITMLVLGAGAFGAGAMVTRAEELKLSKEGVEAKMTPMYKVDHAFTVAIEPGETPALAASHAASPEKAVEEALPTVAELLAGATEAGWAVAQTSGVSQIMLTKSVREARPGLAVGDTVMVSVPIDWLMAPVPVTVMNTLRTVGFEIPPHSATNQVE